MREGRGGGGGGRRAGKNEEGEAGGWDCADLPRIPIDKETKPFQEV